VNGNKLIFEVSGKQESESQTIQATHILFCHSMATA